MKTKRIILVSALSVFSVFMLIMLIARFNGNSAAVDNSAADETTTATTEADIVIITPHMTTTTPPTGTEAPETTEILSEEKNADETEPETAESEEPNIIVQDFPEATKPEPPENPSNQISEEVLTNPDVMPTYQSEQTTVAQTTTAPKANEPYNGQKKDGKIYIEGFGWVVDEGGVGVGSVNNEMYQNGNKIGTFG